ncbi:hypothetical protein [Curtobacterium pusillum]|uniref:hypothetical protein n=1 Tax=Curtobacterium pusillum TaxID=69373 RepID=UPI0011A94F53|nr:hypothetical protein [Curtobacterium pusillum]
MKHLMYGGELLLTTDAVAYTIIDYAIALAQNGLADRVTLPTFDVEGDAVLTTILLAPGLPLLAQEAPPGGASDESAVTSRSRAFVDDLSARTLALRLET